MSLFGATYGALGGQAAANEVSGQQKGWNFVEDMRDQTQRRRIQQETWALESERRLQNIKDQQMKIFAKEQAIGQTGALTTENMQQIQEQQKRLRKQLGQVEADQIRGLVNRFLGSSAPAEELDSMNAWFEQHPEQAAKYGMKPGMKLMPVTYDNPYDRREVANYLMRVDPNFANLSKDIQDKYVRDEIASGTYVNAGGKVFNAEHFGAGIGATQTAPAEVKAKLARKNSGEAVSSKVAQSKMDGKQMSKATSEIAPIEEGSSSDSGKSSTFNPWARLRGAAKEKLSPDVVQAAEPVLQKYGLKVKSGYRDPEHNKRVGGAPKSQHLSGNAIDIDWADKSEAERQAIIKDLRAQGFTGFGVGPTSLHADKGPQRSWSYYGGTSTGGGKMPRWAAEALSGEVPAAQQSVAPSGQYASSSPQQAAYGSSMSQPYRAASTLTKDEVLRNLAGWPDQRTAMMKNMDYVASQLSPDATLGDVMQTMQTMESGGSTNKIMQTYNTLADLKGKAFADEWLEKAYTAEKSAGRPFEYQQQIMDTNAMLDAQVAEGKLDPEMAAIIKRQNAQEVMDSQKYGTGYTSDMARASKQVAARKLWDRLKEDPTKLSPVVEDKLQIAENMAKKPLEPKQRELYEGQVNLAERANKIARLIEEKGPDAFNRGDIGWMEQWLGTRGGAEAIAKAKSVGSELLNKASEALTGSPAIKPITNQEVLDRVVNTVGLESELGMLTSDYLRMQSGTAVAEPEFIRLIGGVLAGLGSQDPAQTAKALKTFADVNAMSARQKAETFGERGYGYTAAKGYKRLSDAYRRYGYTMPDSTKMATVRDTSYTKPMKKPQGPSTAQQAPIDLRQYKAGGTYGDKKIKRAGWDNKTAERVLQLEDGTIVRLK